MTRSSILISLPASVEHDVDLLLAIDVMVVAWMMGEIRDRSITCIPTT